MSGRFSAKVAALCGLSLLVTTPLLTGAHAGSWEDAFTADELEVLFGGAGNVPRMIGPHPVVMSMEEAEQIEGEAAPILVAMAWGAGVGAAAGGLNAFGQGGSVPRGIAAGTVGGAFAGAFMPVASAGAWGVGVPRILGAAGGASLNQLQMNQQNGVCLQCHK